MRIFITGFEGYVGRRVVDALRRRNVPITALCRSADAASRAEKLGIRPAKVGLDDPEALAVAVLGHDAVGHFAASDTPGFAATERAAIPAILAALPLDGALVTQGGTLVFGDRGRDAPTVDPAFDPPPALAVRAELDEMVLRAGHRGRRTCVVYGAFVFGGDGAMIPDALRRSARAHAECGYPGDGSAVWSAVHVEDWAELMASALLAGPAGGHAVIAAAQEVRIADAAAAIGRGVEPPKPARPIGPRQAKERYPAFAEALDSWQRFDGAPARDMFGWRPRDRDVYAELTDGSGHRRRAEREGAAAAGRVATRAEYEAAVARVEALSGVPLGGDDPEAEELDEWLRAIEAYEADGRPDRSSGHAAFGVPVGR